MDFVLLALFDINRSEVEAWLAALDERASIRMDVKDLYAQ